MTHTPEPANYTSVRSRSTAAEQTLYLVVRIGVVLAGMFIIAAMLFSEFLTPELLYEDAPVVPPLRERLPGIVGSFGIGALLCVPHRWTQRGTLFWPRFACYVLLAVITFVRAAQGILAGMAGGKHWLILPASAMIASIGAALPLCLLWSRRIRRSP